MCRLRAKFTQIYDTGERAVRDLPWSGFTATVFVEVYRVHCPDCGVKREKVPLLPGKAPFSKRFEDAVGLACEMASARQVARQFGLAASTVRAIDLSTWSDGMRRGELRRCAKWAWMRSIWARSRSFSAWCGTWRPANRYGSGGTEEREVGWIFPDRTERPATARDRGGLRGYVGAIPAEH